MKQYRVLPIACLLLVLSAILAACAPGPPQAAVPTAPPPPPTVFPTATATPTATAAPTATLQPTITPPPRVTLAFTGDLMLARSIGRALEADPATTPFAAVGDALRAADLTIGNLECALGTIGEPAPKAFTFLGPPAAAPALAAAGFDLLALANNHSLDYGPEALAETISLLADQGIAAVGAGPNEATAHQPAIFTVNGMRLAFLAYVNVPVERGGFVTESWAAVGATPGVAWAHPERVAADVAAARAVSDRVIVLLHSGYEGLETPNDMQRANAYAAIDAGATLVIGHHPHVLQGLERRGAGVIAYSLGNFVFDGFDGAGAESAILNITIGPGGVEAIAWRPVVLVDGRPMLAAGEAAADILARIEALSAQLR